MSLCKSRQILNCCHPNALLTLKEYLQDYASPATRAVYDRIRTVIPPIEEDVVMHPLMVRAEELVKEHALSQAAEAVCGELK